MKKTYCAALPFLLACLALTGCKKLGSLSTLSRGGSANGTSSSASGRGQLSSSDKEVQAKLQPLIHCINGPLSHYEDIQQEYHKVIATQKHAASQAPFGGYPVIPAFTLGDVFEFKISPSERNHEIALACANGLDKSVTLPPPDPSLDQPAKDLSQAIRAILQPGDQMDDYVDQKGFVADHFEKGRTLDAMLSPLLDRIVADSQKLGVAVRTQESALRQHQLDAIDKAEGHSLRWHTIKNLVEARALDEKLRSLAHDRQLNPDSVGAAIKPLQDAFDDTQAFLAQHPEAGKPDAGNNQPVWFSMRTDLSSEIGAANRLRADFTDSSMSPDIKKENIDSDLVQVENDFNELIQTYNTEQ